MASKLWFNPFVCLFSFFLSWACLLFSGIVNSKLIMNRPQFGQSFSQQGFFSSSRDSISPPCATRTSHTHVSATASEMDLSRKNRRKERGRLKAGEQPLLDSWNRAGARGSTANTLGTNASSNHLGISTTAGGCNGTDRYFSFFNLGCQKSPNFSELLHCIVFFCFSKSIVFYLLLLDLAEDRGVRLQQRHVHEPQLIGHLCSIQLVVCVTIGQWSYHWHFYTIFG